MNRRLPSARSLPDPAIIYGNLIAALVQRREELKLSQLELDEIAGFNQSTIAKYEVGERRPSTFALSIWAASLGVRIVILPLTLNDVLSDQYRKIGLKRPWRRT